VEESKRFAGLNRGGGRGHGVPVYWWTWQGVQFQRHSNANLTPIRAVFGRQVSERTLP